MQPVVSSAGGEQYPAMGPNTWQVIPQFVNEQLPPPLVARA